MIIFKIAPETIIAQADIDTYKGCIKKHVEPCIVRIDHG